MANQVSLAEPVRVDSPLGGADERRARLQFQLEVLAAAEAVAAEIGGLDPINPYADCLWSYHEPESIAGASDENRRINALGWLRTHARAVREVARRLGHTGPIVKVADGSHFGVSVAVRSADGPLAIIDALVPAQTTCEMVDTGEVTFKPGTDPEYVPVMERRCPPSIFGGIEQEVAS